MLSRAQRRLRALLFSVPKTVTLSEIAAVCGVTAGAVCHWYDGRRRPTRQSMRALEDRFGIPMRDWVTDDECAHLRAAE